MYYALKLGPATRANIETVLRDVGCSVSNFSDSVWTYRTLSFICDRRNRTHWLYQCNTDIGCSLRWYRLLDKIRDRISWGNALVMEQTVNTGDARIWASGVPGLAITADETYSLLLNLSVPGWDVPAIIRISSGTQSTLIDIFDTNGEHKNLVALSMLYRLEHWYGRRPACATRPRIQEHRETEITPWFLREDRIRGGVEHLRQDEPTMTPPERGVYMGGRQYTQEEITNMYRRLNMPVPPIPPLPAVPVAPIRRPRRERAVER